MIEKLLIIGGMSYETSTNYYKFINETYNLVNNNINDLELILYNVNFQKIIKLMEDNNWKEISNYFELIINNLNAFKINKIVLASNTIHNVIEYLPKNIEAKIINITDCIIKECKIKKYKNIGYVGTSYLMKADYLDKMFSKNELNLFKLEKENFEEVDNIIFKDLCQGTVTKHDKDRIIAIIKVMIKEKFLDCVVLGCTELGLLEINNDINIDIIDSAEIHLKYIVNYLKEKKHE